MIWTDVFFYISLALLSGYVVLGIAGYKLAKPYFYMAQMRARQGSSLRAKLNERANNRPVRTDNHSGQDGFRKDTMG